MLRKNNITLFHTEQVVKASIVERFNHTLRELIVKFIENKQSLTYINHLPKLIEVYNNKPHRTLGGHCPNDVNDKNRKYYYELMYKNYLEQKKKKFKYNINDTVRVSTYKKLFQRTEHQNFTNSLYTIIDRTDTNPPTCTLCEKESKEPVIGSFYTEEVSLVK